MGLLYANHARRYGALIYACNGNLVGWLVAIWSGLGLSLVALVAVGPKFCMRSITLLDKRCVC